MQSLSSVRRIGLDLRVLAATFLLLGLTLPRWPNCRGLRNKCGGPILRSTAFTSRTPTSHRLRSSLPRRRGSRPRPLAATVSLLVLRRIRCRPPKSLDRCEGSSLGLPSFRPYIGSSFSASREGGSLRTLSRGTDVPFSGLPVGPSLPPFRIGYSEVRSAQFSSGPVHYSLNCRVPFSCRHRQYLGLTSDPLPTAEVSSPV